MRLSAFIAALVLFSSQSHAQQPQLFGTWVMDTTRSDSAAQADPIVATRLVITQTPSEVRIQTLQGKTERIMHYTLDGNDTLSRLGADNATGRMRWDGAQLVTDTVYNIGETALAQKATYALSSDGREMTVTYELRVLHGYEGNHPDTVRKDPNYSTGKDVFVRP